MTNIHAANRGDKIKLVTGEHFIFVEVKRTRFIGKSLKDNKDYSIPISSFKEIIEKAPPKKVNDGYKNLVFGELFYIEHKSEACLYRFEKLKRKQSGRLVIVAENIINGRLTSIDTSLYAGKISEL